MSYCAFLPLRLARSRPPSNTGSRTEGPMPKVRLMPISRFDGSSEATPANAVSVTSGRNSFFATLMSLDAASTRQRAATTSGRRPIRPMVRSSGSSGVALASRVGRAICRPRSGPLPSSAAIWLRARAISSSTRCRSVCAAATVPRACVVSTWVSSPAARRWRERSVRSLRWAMARSATSRCAYSAASRL
ncbi:hypothetical protein D3C86_1542610 [compost metagenome]